MMDDQTTPRLPRKEYRVRTLRVLRTHLPIEAYKELNMQAALRGWDLPVLAAELLTKVAFDKLANAVLDDEARPTAHPASADRS